MIYRTRVRPDFSRRVAPMYAIAFATATSLLPWARQQFRAIVKRALEQNDTRGKPCLIT